MPNKKEAVILILLFLFFICLGVIAWSLDEAAAVPLETLEDIFIDVDGDGDLDFVHSVQFVRQQNEEVEANPAPVQENTENPTPAPQPGQ